MNSVAPSRWHSAATRALRAPGRAAASCSARRPRWLRVGGAAGRSGARATARGPASASRPVRELVVEHARRSSRSRCHSAVVRVLDRQRRGRRSDCPASAAAVERARARGRAPRATSRRRRCGASLMREHVRAARRSHEQRRAAAARRPRSNGRARLLRRARPRRAARAPASDSARSRARPRAHRAAAWITLAPAPPSTVVERGAQRLVAARSGRRSTARAARAGSSGPARARTLPQIL